MQKMFRSKIQSLADFSFVVSHLEIHPAVHLNTSRADVSAVKRNIKSVFVYWLQENIYMRQIFI